MADPFRKSYRYSPRHNVPVRAVNAFRAPEPPQSVGPEHEVEPEVTEAPERDPLIAELTEKLAHQRELTRAHEIRAAQAAEDIEQAKQRIEREASRALEQKSRTFLHEFLEVLDDLDRALDSTPAGGDRATLEGVELVRKRFLSKLSDHGVTYLPAIGAAFDPSLHEAVAAVPVDRPTDDGIIIAEIRKGYRIGNELLRAARVAVGRLS